MVCIKAFKRVGINFIRLKPKNENLNLLAHKNIKAQNSPKKNPSAPVLIVKTVQITSKLIIVILFDRKLNALFLMVILCLKLMVIKVKELIKH